MSRGLPLREHEALPPGRGLAFGLLVLVRHRGVDGRRQVRRTDAARLLALRPVQLLVDLVLRVATLEEGRLGRPSSVRLLGRRCG